MRLGQDLGRRRVVLVVEHMEYQGQHRQKLRVHDEPVRANQHALFLNLKTDAHDISADFDARSPVREQEPVRREACWSGSVRWAIQERPVQHHLDVGIGEPKESPNAEVRPHYIQPPRKEREKWTRKGLTGSLAHLPLLALDAR